jgi:hypothetical protein
MLVGRKKENANKRQEKHIWYLISGLCCAGFINLTVVPPSKRGEGREKE